MRGKERRRRTSLDERPFSGKEEEKERSRRRDAGGMKGSHRNESTASGGVGRRRNYSWLGAMHEADIGFYLLLRLYKAATHG